ncbi:transferase family-domain-containing protein [Tricladium varicosporioides]|nr:transferase family-domain-containing protein [Hymenoscyphus varicosporioides]
MATALDVEVTSSTTIFPESKGELKTIPLSIIDSTVVHFSRCAAIWYFDPPKAPRFALSGQLLQDALTKTLSSYPQLSGRLSYSPHCTNQGHTNRYRRFRVTFNAPTDIGVPFVTAESKNTLSDFLPDTEIRRSSMKAWDGSQLPLKGLFPSAPLAFTNDKVPADAPNMTIQLTTFACSSVAVAISITHCFADAQALSRFAKDYSSIARALFNSSPIPTLSPIFDPQLLDNSAAGNIDAEEADPVIQEKARRLPMHIYDNYMPVPNPPWPTDPPADYSTVAHLPLSPSKPIPWEEWNVKAPCSHRILHFTPDELSNIYHMTVTPKNKISKLDALLAHVWARINISRQLPEGTLTWLDMSFGLRARVNPLLPPSFLGSPILAAAIPYPNTSPSTPVQLSAVATQIRKTIAEFTPDAVSAILHDSAFEVSPQRLWRCFLGKKHVMLTTWLYLGLEEVNFIGTDGPKLRYISPVMPSCDGLVDVLETLGEAKGHWSSNGVDVSVFLEKNAMDRLLADPMLWGEQDRDGSA